jgi:hypothetical protein
VFTEGSLKGEDANCHFFAHCIHHTRSERRLPAAILHAVCFVHGRSGYTHHSLA